MECNKQPMEMNNNKKPVKKWRFKIHKMVLPIRGRQLSMKERSFNMGKGLKFGLMILNTLANGNMDNNQARVSKLGMQLIRLILAVGKMVLSMVKVSKLGMMDPISKGIGFMM